MARREAFLTGKKEGNKRGIHMYYTGPACNTRVLVSEKQRMAACTKRMQLAGKTVQRTHIPAFAARLSCTPEKSVFSKTRSKPVYTCVVACWMTHTHTEQVSGHACTACICICMKVAVTECTQTSKSCSNGATNHRHIPTHTHTHIPNAHTST